MVIQGRQPARKPPRFFEVWDAVRARLASATMEDILSPDLTTATTDRIVLAGTPAAATDKPAGAVDTKPWARLWVVPVTTPWSDQEQLGRDQPVAFMVRTDMHVPAGSAFPLARRMEASQEEAFLLLHGWVPGAFEFAEVNFPINREVAPQPMPLWDPARGLWYESSVYHIYVSPVSL